MGGRPGGPADFTGGAADSTGERLCGVGHGRGAARVRDFRRATTGSVEEIYEKTDGGRGSGYLFIYLFLVAKSEKKNCLFKL